MSSESVQADWYSVLGLADKINNDRGVREDINRTYELEPIDMEEVTVEDIEFFRDTIIAQMYDEHVKATSGPCTTS
jgi:hypothetical protein